LKINDLKPDALHGGNPTYFQTVVRVHTLLFKGYGGGVSRSQNPDFNPIPVDELDKNGI